jgi:hypothetical protein
MDMLLDADERFKAEFCVAVPLAIDGQLSPTAKKFLNFMLARMACGRSSSFCAFGACLCRFEQEKVVQC